jgi:hypothetical protein
LYSIKKIVDYKNLYYKLILLSINLK